MRGTVPLPPKKGDRPVSLPEPIACVSPFPRRSPGLRRTCRHICPASRTAHRHPSGFLLKRHDLTETPFYRGHLIRRGAWGQNRLTQKPKDAKEKSGEDDQGKHHAMVFRSLRLRRRTKLRPSQRSRGGAIAGPRWGAAALRTPAVGRRRCEPPLGAAFANRCRRGYSGGARFERRTRMTDRDLPVASTRSSVGIFFRGVLTR